MRDGTTVVQALGGNVLGNAATEASNCREKMEMILRCIAAIELDKSLDGNVIDQKGRTGDGQPGS